jgi:hypothetical protein
MLITLLVTYNYYVFVSDTIFICEEVIPMHNQEEHHEGTYGKTEV